jgi:hypothetical protein
MSTSVRQADLTGSRRQLRELIDRSDITALVSRLGIWLDEKRWEEARSIFIDDATANTPGGSVAGADRFAEHARRTHVVPTHHVITNVLIDLDGDRAAVGANLIATFVGGPSSPPRAVRRLLFRCSPVSPQATVNARRSDRTPRRAQPPLDGGGEH